MNRYLLQMSALEGYALALYDTQSTHAHNAVVAQFKDKGLAEITQTLLNNLSKPEAEAKADD